MSDIHYKSADGLDLFAKSYGPEDAPLSVLCMHGLTRNHKDFEPMIERLGDRYRFIAVDVRGRGQSDWTTNPDTYSPQIYAQDMFALADQLQLSRMALIGTSMGGLMAMIMAKVAPERVSGMVLNDVGPVVNPAGLARIAAYSQDPKPVPTWQAAAEKVKAAQADAFPDFTGKDWMAFAKRTWREQEDGSVRADYDPAITRSLGEAKAGPLTKFAMWRMFGSLRSVPLLILRGETSDILSKSTARRMARRHPASELVTIPNRGHTPILDEPTSVSAISTFLQLLESK
ncbi:alpha/beta hydrolase [Henriciella barbarensis]|uniref:Alpha/beta hydrolase n=1 Tax=Henriciella barbarensis TaxID=86342 RepID=A0A399QTW9_9PROT|nr:alpha/beta hydrolase [Henriciella barbarensis]RIJ21635.1 alpha/beta hydrolase [Henriciella barbarensis]